jgi:hypothetical protein
MYVPKSPVDPVRSTRIMMASPYHKSATIHTTI